MKGRVKLKYAITGATGHLGQQIVAAMRPLVATTELYLGVHTLSKAQVYQQQVRLLITSSQSSYAHFSKTVMS